MSPYNFSAASAILGFEFHSRKVENARQYYWTKTFGENNSNSLLRPKNFLNSFNEQTPHRRLCSRPITSTIRMTGGVPRAPKAAAGSAVLHSNISTPHETDTPEVLTRFGERWQDLCLEIVRQADAGNLQRSMSYDLGLRSSVSEPQLWNRSCWGHLYQLYQRQSRRAVLSIAHRWC